jgi:DNA-directed RNA polymerase-3 subunit RPC5
MPRRRAIKAEEVIPFVVGSMDGIDDKDEVVQEIDVYLSPDLASQLHLLQYPLQHGPVTTAVEASIKPLHNLVQLTQPVPTNIEFGGDKTIAERVFYSETIPITTHMCVGKLQSDGSLHLVPLSHIHQMRPSFDHVGTNHDVDNNDDEIAMDIDDTDDAAHQQQQQKKPVVFQRKESDRAASARKSSYAFKKASEDAEDWMPLTVHDVDSDKCTRILDQVRCPAPENYVLDKHAASDLAYVQSLNYIARDHASLNNSSEALQLDMPSVVARMTRLLIGGCPVPFSILRSQFPSHVPTATLLQALSVCAVLVRGAFLLNSQFLMIPAPLQTARTFVLLLLMQGSLIERARLDQACAYVSSNRLLAILQQVAKRSIEGGWTLKIENDDAFEARFPVHVRAHRNYWEKQNARCQKELKAYRNCM